MSGKEKKDNPLEFLEPLESWELDELQDTGDITIHEEVNDVEEE